MVPQQIRAQVAQENGPGAGQLTASTRSAQTSTLSYHPLAPASGNLLLAMFGSRIQLSQCLDTQIPSAEYDADVPPCLTSRLLDHVPKIFII